MSAPSPLRPNLDRLRRDARQLLDEYRGGDRDAAERIARHLRRARDGAATADRPVGLQEAQFVVARENGFESWPEMKSKVHGATRGAIPVLVVPDLQAAVEFSTTKFGFALEWDYGDPPGYAGMKFGDAEIHLSENPETTNTGAVWLYLQVDDVDAVHDSLVANGVTVEGPPKRRPWGMREIIAVDLNGFRFHIGQSTEEEHTHD